MTAFAGTGSHPLLGRAIAQCHDTYLIRTSIAAMLWACLHFPDLPFAAAWPGAVPPAAVLTDGSLRQPRIVLASAAAHALGVRAGQSLAAARALQAQLPALPRDGEAERVLLDSLAARAYRCSSNVSLAPAGSLLFEVGASLGLFGGWPRLERGLREDFAASGLAHVLAVAPNAAAALVLARRQVDRVFMAMPPLLRELADIPVPECGLAEETSSSLSAMGLTRLGQLFTLPRAELAKRTGPAALVHLDRLRGMIPEVLPAWQPPTRYARRLEFDCRIGEVGALAFPLQRLLREFARFLVARDGGVQRFEIVLEHEGGARRRVPVGLLAPQREAAMLFELSRARLERIELADAVCAMSLVADDLPPLQPLPADLFEEHRQGAVDWPDLGERLRARLGDDALHGLAAHADHRPERAWRRTPLPNATRTKDLPAKSAAPDAASRPDAARPFWLLPHAIPLRPEPAAILAGPERIESGWWDGQDERRDYYVVRMRSGQRAWAYLAAGASGGWMLHGWFA